MALLLALCAAVTYGSSDFLGGLASRRAPVLAVVAVSQLAGTLVLLPLLLVLPETPTAAGLGWGAGSGLAGGAGVALLYRGLSRGRMGIVAPTTAVGAAAVPVLFGLLVGERPGAPALIGIVVALAAIVLVSATPSRTPSSGLVEAAGPGVGVAADGGGGGAGMAGGATRARTGLLPPGLPEAMASGVAFGGFFILLARAGTDSGLWPLLGVRGGSITLVVLGALVTGRSLRPARGTWWLIAGSGVLDMLANALYLAATATGLLSLVAVVTSLYPASTVVLARVVLHERLGGLQVGGLAAAAAGVVLISLG